MSVSSEDAARGVVGRPHAGNAGDWALAGEEKIRSSDGTQRVGGLREMGPRAWLAVAGATRPAIAETVVFRETRALVGPARTTPAAVEEDMANILPERKEGRREWDGAFASRRVREAGG